MTMMKKKTIGRQKIEIKRILGKTTRQVTFSKRRKGLFNKASELCVLTGAQVAILIQSPGSRLFSFGDPNIDSIIDMYLGGYNVSDFSSTSENSNPNCMHDEYNKKYLEITKKLELEKKNSNNVESGEFWWEKSFKDLEGDQLENYIKSMEQLKINVIKKADELMKEKENTSCSLDMTHPNADNFDGLLDDQVSVFDDQFLSNNGGIVDEDLMKRIFDGLDDQVPVIMDQFLPNNGGIVDEDLMMQGVNNDCSLINNDSFGSGDQLVVDHYYGVDDFQVPGDLWSSVVPNDFYFGQGQQI